MQCCSEGAIRFGQNSFPIARIARKLYIRWRRESSDRCRLDLHGESVYVYGPFRRIFSTGKMFTFGSMWKVLPWIHDLFLSVRVSMWVPWDRESKLNRSRRLSSMPPFWRKAPSRPKVCPITIGHVMPNYCRGCVGSEALQLLHEIDWFAT